MIDEVTKIMEPVLYTALTALTAVLITAITKAKEDVVAWLRSKTNKDQQAFIDAVAKEAYAYAEIFGTQKADMAFQYVKREMEKRGLKFDTVKLQAAIQAAWEQYGNNNKGGVTVATQSEIERAVQKVVE